MSTSVVYLVRCDMPNCESRCAPYDGSTAKTARAAAKATGWRRIYIAAGGGAPAHWADVCANHGSGEPT